MIEHIWKGRYSMGEFQVTRLKIMAEMPEKERMKRTMVFVLSERFLSMKYKPVMIAADKSSVAICTMP